MSVNLEGATLAHCVSDNEVMSCAEQGNLYSWMVKEENKVHCSHPAAITQKIKETSLLQRLDKAMIYSIIFIE